MISVTKVSGKASTAQSHKSAVPMTVNGARRSTDRYPICMKSLNLSVDALRSLVTTKHTAANDAGTNIIATIVRILTTRASWALFRASSAMAAVPRFVASAAFLLVSWFCSAIVSCNYGILALLYPALKNVGNAYLTGQHYCSVTDGFRRFL
jgi:hypothetical protein